MDLRANFLVMDLRANFLGRCSANQFISDGTLLLGHILTFFLRNLTANLFFNLSVLFLSNSLAHVRSFGSTFLLISGGALAITNSLARRFDNCRTFLMINGSTFSFVKSGAYPIFNCFALRRIRGGTLLFITSTALAILLNPAYLISHISTFTVILCMTLIIIDHLNIPVIDGVRYSLLNSRAFSSWSATTYFVILSTAFRLQFSRYDWFLLITALLIKNRVAFPFSFKFYMRFLDFFTNLTIFSLTHIVTDVGGMENTYANDKKQEFHP